MIARFAIWLMDGRGKRIGHGSVPILSKIAKRLVNADMERAVREGEQRAAARAEHAEALRAWLMGGSFDALVDAALKELSPDPPIELVWGRRRCRARLIRGPAAD